MCCAPSETLTLQALTAASLICGLAYPLLPLGWVTVRSIVKTAAIAALAALAAVNGAWVLALALTFSAIGDFALSRPGDRAFLLGMIAFGAAHLVYVALFIGLGDLALAITFPRILAALGLLALAVTMARRLSRGAGAFAGPLRGYIGVIAAMGLAALSVPTHSGGALILLGAGLFMASDLLIGHERFAGLRFKGLGLAIWGFYYIGQALILVGVLARA